MSALLRAVIFCLTIAAPTASAETRPEVNVFFGFEYVLTPISIKWSCGGKSDQDLAALDAMIAAYPEDAKEAELASTVDLLLEVSRREGGMTEILGIETTQHQRDQLCAAALPLGLAEIPPGTLTGQSEEKLAAEQEEKWSTFYRVIEGWQSEASP